jgi:succinylglutamate desuccinylase
VSIAHPADTQRYIGKIEKDSGPILLLVAGLHGNEPSAIQAVHEILMEMNYMESKLRGSIYGIRGNLQALAENTRYIDCDLNRMWPLDPDVDIDKNAAEYEEYLSIMEVIREIKSIQGNRELIMLDLHTTSSETLPFILSSHDPKSRRLVKPIPVPTILGVDNRIKGTLGSYLNSLGDASAVFEAGQHRDPFSIMYHKSIIQLFMVGTGIINQTHLEDFEDIVNSVYFHAKNMQYVFEIMFRYGIKPGEKFVMKPGYKNFMKIEQGEVLAHNNRGEIVAPLPGRIFMPLYQDLGDDGFFIIDEI